MPCVYNSTEDCLGIANREIERLTVLLCEAVKDRKSSDLSQPLIDWRLKHELAEEARIRREAAAKLTPQERRVLGL